MDRGEIFNMVSHLVGAAFALIALVVLVVFASLQGGAWRVVSFSVYGFSLFTLYLISTLYHGTRGKTKTVFSVLDHQAIYLLIAGTYTPVTLVALSGAWAWTIFGFIWSMAIVGFVLDTLPQVRKGKRILPVVIYVAMGWTIVVALRPVLDAIPALGFNWLLWGGVFYTSGIVFYALSNRFVYAHGIWHLFVLAGSACHYITILIYI